LAFSFVYPLGCRRIADTAILFASALVLTVAVIGFAWSKKAKYLSLLTSSKLVSAVHLYKNLGFETVQFNEPTNYKRKVFKMVLEL